MSPEPEIILNLWYVRDDKGMIYSLRARAYVGFGSDHEKLAVLRQFALSDYLIAQPFSIPERFHMTVTEAGVKRRLPVTHISQVELAGSRVDLFEEAIVELEKQMPIQTKLTIGSRPLVCITPLLGDDEGGIEPRFTETAGLDRKTGV